MIPLISHFRASIDKVHDMSFRTSFMVGRLFTDSDFLDIHPKETSHKILQKAAQNITKAKKTAQRSALKALSQKSAAGDYYPKPTGKVVLGLAQESLYLLNKLAPALSRVNISPATIGMAFAAATLYLAYDDTARMILTEQVNNMIAVFQSEDNNFSDDKNADQEVQANEAKIETNAPVYQRPFYHI